MKKQNSSRKIASLAFLTELLNLWQICFEHYFSCDSSKMLTAAVDSDCCEARPGIDVCAGKGGQGPRTGDWLPLVRLGNHHVKEFSGSCLPHSPQVRLGNSK